MSVDPLRRLIPAFGDVLVRHRRERNWTVETLAAAAQLGVAEVKSMERGDYGPTLPEFFRIARALGEEAPFLLIDLISSWRADPRTLLNTSRPSDFQRLFRLGYDHKPGDFRELVTSYYSIPEAMHAAAGLNAQRRTRRVAPLTAVTIYVRLGYVSLQSHYGLTGGQER